MPTLLVENGGEPKWFPDGTKIVFARIPYSIWIMNSDGSDTSDLTPAISGAEDPYYPSIPLLELSVAGLVTSTNKLQILTSFLAMSELITVIAIVVVVRQRRKA